MVCPSCYAEHMTKVYYCYEKGLEVRRYRECTKCGQRFVTVEKVLKKIGEPVPGKDDGQ